MNTIWKAKLHNIQEDELDFTVWRYLTFPKFIHLITYGALWFCRLQELIDEFEGRMPEKTLKKMQARHQDLKKTFPDPKHHWQFDEMAERNVRDGRSLTAVNCWFIGEDESQVMWDQYVGSSEGVAIKSTARKIRDNVYLPSDISFMGKVQYVDYSSYEMTAYEANQAHHRAFLKDKVKFSHENELRLSTMNIKTPACINPQGRPFSRKDISGAKMNNFDEPGLLVGVNLPNLFEAVILPPTSLQWFKDLIINISNKANYGWIIEDSKLK